MSNDLEQAVTGRVTSVFADAFAAARPDIARVVQDKTILVAGAAGSIGSAVAEILLEFEPATVLAADIDENGLAELVRYLRASGKLTRGGQVEPLLLDISSRNADLVPVIYGTPDAVMNLAAVKHVRSERDLLSLLRMFETNVIGTRNLQRVLESCNPDGRFFSVSSDKAVNPTSLMGASKRLMELEMARTSAERVSTCRFANVAFSAGSLLDSWLKRIAAAQPTPVPADIRRYFITSREAGELCMLTLAKAEREVFVPDLSADQDLQLLTAVLSRVLEALDLEPEYFDDESAAILAAGRLAAEGRQAVIITPPDTSGEKMFEEFIGEGEEMQSVGLPGIGSAALDAPSMQESQTLRLLGDHRSEELPPPNLQNLIAAVRADVPSFSPHSTATRLDDRD